MTQGINETDLLVRYETKVKDVARVNVYGAGAFGKALIPALGEAGIEVEFLIDRSVTVGTQNGIQVVSPGSSKLDRQIPVLLSVLGYSGIEPGLGAEGFDTVVPTDVVFELFPRALSALTTDGFLWRSHDRELQTDSVGISALNDLLSDGRSRAVLDNLVAFRTSPSRSTYPWPDSHDWYFPPDVPLYPSNGSIAVVDCGAFDGDTLKEYLKRFGGRISEYLAIEANPRNAQALTAWIKDNAWAQHRGETSIRVANVAVSNRRGEIFLSDRENTSSKLIDPDVALQEHPSGYFKVATAPIDEIAAGSNWTHIKMDVEGAEFEAIMGAESIIRTQRPALAISVYHRPQDLWKLPLLVDSYVPGGYEFYLRLEGHWGLETMCYAVPK